VVLSTTTTAYHVVAEAFVLAVGFGVDFEELEFVLIIKIAISPAKIE
jgi:hypothetical protein